MKYWMNVILAVASTGLMVACGGGPDRAVAAPTEQGLGAAADAEPGAVDKVLLPKP